MMTEETKDEVCPCNYCGERATRIIKIDDYKKMFVCNKVKCMIEFIYEHSDDIE